MNRKRLNTLPVSLEESLVQTTIVETLTVWGLLKVSKAITF